MKLTKQQEKEAMKVYQTYWDNYLKGDVESMAGLLDDDYTQIGSAETEVFSNKKDAVKFLHDTIDQVAEKLEMRNRRSRLEQRGNLVLVHELCHIYVLTDDKWVFYSKFRATTIMEDKKDGWKIIHQHSSFPDARTGEGENIAIDKIAEENRELREAVKRSTVELEFKNRELEIEASLEKVRSVAMGMRKPDDMLDVCRIISDQLQSLGVNNIRNVQTAIIHVQKSTYLNYQYFAAYNKSVIEEAEYNKHPKAREMAETMKKSANAFFSQSFDGEELNVFRQYRKQDNQLPDPILEESNSIHFYFYSIGPGALGISTYNSTLSESDTSLFMRFRNVIELAYRRFMDIQQAEAQAREAKIEAALEKVRAAAMSMNKPNDLLNVCEVLYTEFHKLGFGELRNAMINIHNDEKGTFINYDYSDEIGRSINHLTYNIHLIIEKQIKQIRSANDAFSETFFTGEDLEEWKKFRQKIGEKDDPRINNLSALYYYFYSIGTGSIGISTFNPIGEEKLTLLKRFRNVFSLSYQRYSDIALAEAQAREAKIEAALERVRAKAMAMHTSNDLSETMGVLFTELPKLGINSLRCGVVLLSKTSRRGVFYAAATTSDSDAFTMIGAGDMAEHPVFMKQYEGWLNNENYFTSLSDEDLHSYYKAIFARLSIPYIPKEHEVQTEHGYYFAFSEGMFYAWSEKPYAEDEINLLNRFKAIIDLTFRRYLDLQKAEAQAREANIETALERVRSRTMGMQKSEELKEVIRVVYEQFVHLKINVDHAGFVVDYIPKGDWHFWIADEREIPSKITHPYFDSVWAHQFNEAKEKGMDFFATNLNFEEKNKFYQDLFKFIPDVAEESLEFYFNCPGLAGSTVLLDNVGLYIENFSCIPYTDEENNTLMRFGKVFQQTYTRFLDLQKAEAQAREAKIEAALEKVRTVALSLKKSDEMLDIAQVLYEQLIELGFTNIRNSIIDIHNDNNETFLDYDYSHDMGRTVTLMSYYDDPIIEKQVRQIESSSDAFFEIILEGQDLQDLIDIRLKNGESEDPRLRQIEQLTYNLYSFGNGAIGISNFGLLSDEQKIVLKRFRNVFAFAYKRYTDMVRAETQAREAQIEASLERVRSRAMSMHNPDDLSEAVSLFFKELESLNILPWRCGVGRIDEETRTTFLTTTSKTKEGKRTEVNGQLKQTGHPILDGIFENWKLQKEYYPVLLGDGIIKYYSIINPQIAYPDYPLDAVQYGHFIYFQEGFIFAWTENRLSEDDLQIFRRFSSVMSLTYRRYMDLIEAEARVLESTRQASLDRVRAEIASMRTSEDLNLITPIIWRELKTLEVPFFRCGVFIVDEGNSKVQVYLTTPDGKSLGVLNFPIDSNELTSNTVEYWRKKNVYKEHWNKEEFVSWTKSMIEQGQIQNAETYQGSVNPPDSLYLHFVPFAQGMLYVGDTSPLNDEKLQLVKTLAEAFSIAYARYEDFKNLEEAKNKIEVTLKELKSAQVQLIHSEKMASLGELTAGIAHEIKNPLNFINNFSEISTELLDEMQTELNSGGNRNEDVKVIVNNLKLNLEKINQHGKRADSIVKGMLLHSRGTSGEKVLTNINGLLDQYVMLAYHGLRAQNKEFNITIEKDYDETLEKINIVPQDISRVFLNLVNNACYAANEKKKYSDDHFVPKLKISTKNLREKVEIRIRDNGNGIPQSIRKNIFNPFFTTKPAGEGTGLGLSLSYDIMVKQYNGEIKFESEEGKFTEFIITLPK